MITLGVLADTHVPDRARHLDPKVISIFQDAKADVILHAGDVCAPNVLAQLGTIAPVHAVRGNRDVWQLPHLPAQLSLKFNGVEIGLTHGHDGITGYLSQKLSYLIKGYQLSRFEKQLKRMFPGAQVLIFGHTHRSENTWIDDVLIFNPGPSSRLYLGNIEPSVGLLRIQKEGGVTGEIIPL